MRAGHRHFISLIFNAIWRIKGLAFALDLANLRQWNIEKATDAAYNFMLKATDVTCNYSNLYKLNQLL